MRDWTESTDLDDVIISLYRYVPDYIVGLVQPKWLKKKKSPLGHIFYFVNPLARRTLGASVLIFLGRILHKHPCGFLIYQVFYLLWEDAVAQDPFLQLQRAVLSHQFSFDS
jgi:hypothetical protein